MFTKFQKLFGPDDGAGDGGDTGTLLGPDSDDGDSLLGPSKTEEPEKKEVIDTGNKQISSPENALEKSAADVKEPNKKEPDKTELTKKEDEKPVPKAPEKYEDFKMPDGLQMNAPALEKALVKFKELDLTQEQAQSLIDIQTEMAQEQTKTYQELFEKQKSDWKKQAIQELGANYKEELSFGAKFRDQCLSPETVAFLDENGLFNHPAIVKDFIKAGKMLAEDKFESEGKKISEPSLGELFYPNMKK
jgi:hypothetical protein